MKKKQGIINSAKTGLPDRISVHPDNLKFGPPIRAT